jgi:hypothetical protein
VESQDSNLGSGHQEEQLMRKEITINTTSVPDRAKLQQARELNLPITLAEAPCAHD